MKLGKNISLEIETWSDIETFQKENGIDNISAATEDLVRRGLDKK